MNGHGDTYGMPAQNGQNGMQNFTFAPPNSMGAYGQDKKSTMFAEPLQIQPLIQEQTTFLSTNTIATSDSKVRVTTTIMK